MFLLLEACLFSLMSIILFPVLLVLCFIWPRLALKITNDLLVWHNILDRKVEKKRDQ